MSLVDTSIEQRGYSLRKVHDLESFGADDGELGLEDEGERKSQDEASKRLKTRLDEP